jgi:hypothetical protein
MDRMNEKDSETKPIESKLDALFAEYRGACPDPDGGVNFMPNLWQKIDARRAESVPVLARSPELRLNALFAEYREACPDQDGGVNFMPNLWQKIEARRNESVSVFRRLAQACVLATAALTVAMVILIPHIQKEPVYTATYVDVLDAAHSVDSAQLFDSGDVQ